MTIEQRRQMNKFKMYGLLKNLQFFEPFLYMYLLLNEFSVFQISLLIAIRYFVVYVFEIPSGVFADRFGKKTELIVCFLFYIASFILYFIGGSYFVFMLAMIAFGFGEALRTGTHKAMIMDYLDKENLIQSKSEIYGKTRSYSLIGSTISGLLGVLFIFITPEIRYLFLIAIIPFFIDILLIASYPSYMNEKRDTQFELKGFIKIMIGTVYYALKEKKLRGYLFSSSSYEAWFKAIKGYIQIIMVSLGIVMIEISGITQEENLAVHLGIFYAVMMLLSSFGSSNAHKFKPMFTERFVTTVIWIPTAFLMFLLGYFINNIYVVVLIFTILYVLFNIRKPLMIGILGDHIEKDKRASVLSIESQLSTLLVSVFSVIIGYIVTVYGLGVLFYSLSAMMVIGFSMLYVFQTKRS